MIGFCEHFNRLLRVRRTRDFLKIRRRDNLSHGINYSVKIRHIPATHSFLCNKTNEMQTPFASRYLLIHTAMFRVQVLGTLINVIRKF